MQLVAALFLVASPILAQHPHPTSSATEYHIVKRILLGGAGSWDYLSLDTATNRLFIARTDRMTVVDATTGKMLGEIPGLDHGHGVAFAYSTGHGFVTSGEDSTVTMIDLATLKVLGKTTAALDDDAVLYDPATKRVFTLNGDAGSATAIDATSGKRIGTFSLGGKPEFGVTAENGKLYANIADKAEVVEIDARQLKVTRRWSIAPCTEPSGLAIDRAHARIFSGCRSKVMAISDVKAGKLIATVPIGAGVDANAFDPGTQDAFSSNGDGTLTVVHEDTPDRFHVAQTVTTMSGARTMALNPRTHRIYTVSAKFGPKPTVATKDNPRRYPPIIPDSFTLIVLER
jgi:DNA-binding beta-propeller fold protein YncE